MKSDVARNSGLEIKSADYEGTPVSNITNRKESPPSISSKCYAKQS